MSKVHGVTHFTPDTCFGCRVKTVALPSPNSTALVFQPHYNWSVGQFVRTRQELKDALSRASDINSDVTGCEHKYEYREPGDLEPIRDADGVFDKTAANIRAIKLNEPLPYTTVTEGSADG